MATNIKELISEDSIGDINVETTQNPTITFFGRKIDRNSFYTNLLQIILISVTSYLLNKYYNIFTRHKSLSLVYLGFVAYIFTNIFTSSIKSGDVLFEQSKLEKAQDSLLFMLGIISIIVVFFSNIVPYTINDKIVMQVLVITFIINVVSLLNVSVRQRGEDIRIVRKIKESAYTLITYLLVVIFVYGFIYSLAKEGEIEAQTKLEDSTLLD